MWVVNEKQKIFLLWHKEKPLTMRSSSLAILKRKPHAKMTLFLSVCFMASKQAHGIACLPTWQYTYAAVW